MAKLISTSPWLHLLTTEKSGYTAWKEDPRDIGSWTCGMVTDYWPNVQPALDKVRYNVYDSLPEKQACYMMKPIVTGDDILFHILGMQGAFMDEADMEIEVLSEMQHFLLDAAGFEEGVTEDVDPVYVVIEVEVGDD